MRLFARGPHEFQRTTARLLNDEGFTFKELAPHVLAEKLTVRNKGFVSSVFWVDKTNPSQPVDLQKAVAGSVKHDRFDGWASLIPGGPEPDRNRLLGANARGGSMQSQARRENRLMPGTMPGTRDFPGIPERSRVAAMLRILAADPVRTQGSKGKFVIQGGSWRSGVYRFKPGYQARLTKTKEGIKVRAAKQQAILPAAGIQRVQTLGESPAGMRVDWPRITLDRLGAWFSPAEVWANYLDPLFNKLGGK